MSGGSSARRTTGPADAVTVLTVFIVLLFAIPSTLIFRPLGAAGTPANIVGILCLVWCLVAALAPRLGVSHGPQPVRAALFLWAMAVLASYVAAMTRGISPEEITSADRGLLMLAGWVGVALLVTDGVRSRARLDVLLRRLVTAGALLAVLGLVQFFTGFDLAAHIHIPGLSANWDAAFVQERSGFHRVAGTTTHPIEFGVTLATILPIAVAKAFEAVNRRRWAWTKVVVIAIALPMSLSRSAFVVVGCAALIYVPTWTRQQRRKAAWILPFGSVVMRVLVPGLLGTIMSLFVNMSSDPSYTARTGRYGIAGHFIIERPLFGRGFETFLPKNYLIFDNQYLGTTIETGIVGLSALLLLFAVAFVSARGARRRSRTAADRQVGQALAGSVLGACLAFATYDALSFPISAAVTFFIIGCAGAHWRLSGGSDEPFLASPPPVTVSRTPASTRAAAPVAAAV